MQRSAKTERQATLTHEAPRLILGVDGGGSKTAALLARLEDNGNVILMGHGHGGPSNLLLAGKEQSLTSLDQAINEAMDQAGVSGRTLDYAVLAMAGSTSPDVQRDLSDWTDQRRFASRYEIVHDVAPVLASGTDEGQGIALIIGTGSVAVGVDARGESVLKGGWGHWFGDKGSGFYLGYRALSAVAEASDEIGPETILSKLVMLKLDTFDPRRILEEVSAHGDTRQEVAALAPVVLRAAGMNDAVAEKIVDGAVTEAVKLVSAVAKTLGFERPYQLALAGGVVCGSALFREKLITKLNQLQPAPGMVTTVDNPVEGCLKIAGSRLSPTNALPGTGFINP